MMAWSLCHHLEHTTARPGAHASLRSAPLAVVRPPSPPRDPPPARPGAHATLRPAPLAVVPPPALPLLGSAVGVFSFPRLESGVFVVQPEVARRHGPADRRTLTPAIGVATTRPAARI